MVQSQGPDYTVETGRRDGNVSMKEDALSDLPPADGNVTVLTKFFAAKNLSIKDLVALVNNETFFSLWRLCGRSRVYRCSLRRPVLPMIREAAC